MGPSPSYAWFVLALLTLINVVRVGQVHLYYRATMLDDSLDPGEYVLSVSAKGYPPLRREATVSGAVADLGDAVLEDPRTISGTVRVQ